MRFQGIRMRGIGPYREEVEVDFDSLSGPLVAVQGPNGSGKSVFLGALLGGIYRDVPTRGSLMDLATERGAFVEVRVVNGAAWTLRQTVDPVSKKSEALITDADGRPVIDDAKVRSADAWVKANLPPVEVLLSSIFGAQGSEGFLAMKPADRKGVLLRLLGVEHLEELAAHARERARETKQALAVMEARIADERQRGGDVESLRRQHAERMASAKDAREALAEARAAVEAARAAEAAIAQHRALVGRLDALSARERELAAVVERADEIRSAVGARDALAAEIAGAEEEARAEAAAASRRRQELEQLRVDHARAKGAVEEAERRAERARQRLADRDRVEGAIRDLPDARKVADEAAHRAREAEGALDRLRSQRVAGAEERIEGLRGALADVASWSMGRTPGATMVIDIEDHASSSLSRDDEHVQRAAELPRQLRDVERALGEARRCESQAADHVRELELVAGRADDVERAAEDLAAAERERDAVRASIDAIRAFGVERRDEAKAHEAKHAELYSRLHGLHERHAQARQLAAQAERLAAAEAQLDEVQQQAAQLRADLDELPSPADGPSLADCERAASDAERAAHAADRALGDVEAAIARAVESAERVEALANERAAVERDLSEWNILARDLGKDGVQASLIDAAGPELTALCNDLLHACVGPRWSISIETTRMSADGKRQLEGLDVRVIDTERGRDALVETYSGGERVILGEAVSLALAALACRRAGVEGPTIVRDESGAALDPVRARQWVAMVRRAGELIGASKVLIVAHNPEVSELCDSRLIVVDGRVEVAA